VNLVFLNFPSKSALMMADILPSCRFFINRREEGPAWAAGGGCTDQLAFFLMRPCGSLAPAISSKYLPLRHRSQMASLRGDLGQPPLLQLFTPQLPLSA
jgi:hypothetical protein